MENTDLNLLCSEIIKNKFADGTVENIISKAIENALNDVIKNMLNGYNSTLKQALESKLKPILETSIANSSVEGLTDKLTMLINGFIADKELSDINIINDNLSKYVGLKKYRYNDTVKISEIFKQYQKWLEEELKNISFDRDELDFDEGSASCYFDCKLEYIEIEENKSFFGHKYEDEYSLTVEPQNEDEIISYSEEDYNFKFKLKKAYDEKYYRLKIDTDFTLSDLPNIPSFILYLYNIAKNCVNIELDKTYLSDELCIEVEYE